MEYRAFGNTGIETSVLGFGCMRLPTVDGNTAHIDEEHATRMLHYAIDKGVNYVDTAYPYHKGESERFVGRALKNGYREKVQLATKLPVWLAEKKDDFDRLLHEQLEKLQTNHIDFYLLHALNAERWQKILNLQVFDWAEKALSDGRIAHLGFSFHDEYETFPKIVDGWDGWSFCQIQYNYLDEDHQAGTRGLEYAASKGLAVVVMEPLRGGNIVDPPPRVDELWRSAVRSRPPVKWALDWLWSRPDIPVVLSGMSTMQQVEENVRYASEIEPLSADEVELVARVRDRYAEVRPVPCTQCEYCLPCPHEVAIPKVFKIYNDGIAYNREDAARARYARLSPENNASACVQCRVCEDKCPQSIEISAWMTRIEEAMAG